MQTQQFHSQRSLAAAIAVFSEGVAGSAPSGIVSDGLQLIRHQCSADQVTLSSAEQHGVTPVGTSPVRNMLRDSCSTDWFPWGFNVATPERFLFVQNAETLPFAQRSSQTLGELGLRSCVYLPILDRQQLIGALQLYWSAPRTEWDDSTGQILRSLGRLLLASATGEETAPQVNSSRVVHLG